MATGHQNNLPFRNAQGCFIAVGIVSISLSLGYTSGFSLNPARDFGPRLFIALAGKRDLILCSYCTNHNTFLSSHQQAGAQTFSLSVITIS
jgi:glycerol uptake facilitator-like aquaporin